MKRSNKLMSLAAIALAAVSCGSVEKMAEQAEKVIVNCNPEVLEVVAGKIDANVSVTYPEDYFNPKAILEVTPVIVYEGGEVAGKKLYYQGEKVVDNYTVVPSAGATVTEHLQFDYVKGMEKCHLELRGVAKYKAKSAELPVKKVADGANTTYMLVEKCGKLDLKADGYQAIIKETAEGQILYTINSSDVRSSQLKSQSIKDFQNAIDQIKADDRREIKSTDIVAYASPDGGKDLNSKLSDKRSNTAEKAFGKVTKKHEVDAAVNVQSIGQDWEGFQELVAASNIEDKDLIIRVLSMYSDPAVREQEIKNMSEVYSTLKTSVLPELRRARFIANVEYTNYTSEELKDLVEQNIDVLDEPALLHAATLVAKSEDKLAIYKKAIEKYNSNTAKYNSAVVNIKDGKLDKAASELAALAEDADVLNAKGVIALQNGKLDEAAKLFAKAGNETATENSAIVDILNGNYNAAASKLAGKKGCNAGLAQLLVKNYNAAAEAIVCKCAHASYLKAVVAARQGKAAEVKSNLEAASKDAELAARAAKDVEFAQYR